LPTILGDKLRAALYQPATPLARKDNHMPLNLYVKRAKSFLLNTEDGERALTLYAGNTGPQPAPDWIKQTMTYKLGVKDGSIIDLTVPATGHGRARKNVVEVSAYNDKPQEIGKNAVAVLNEPPSSSAKPVEEVIVHKPFGNPQPAPVKGLQSATVTATGGRRGR
jgi:hypothetical protein